MHNINPKILDDLASDDCLLEVIPSWTVEHAEENIWLHSEKGDSLIFSGDMGEYHILTETSSAGLIERRISRSTGKRYKISALVNLWALGVIRVRDEQAALYDSGKDERFRWQDEYFKAFSNSENSVSLMNRKLRNSSVCIIGAGAAGSLAALILTAAGVGRIRLIDGDIIALSNLPRQFLYPESSVGRLKVEVLREILMHHSSQVKVENIAEFINSQKQAVTAVRGTDFVLLTADQPRLKIREWVGKASLELHIPYLAMASNWIGPISVPFNSLCYLCQARNYRSRYPDPTSFVKKLIEEPLPDRSAFGPRPASVASFMASTILHFLSGNSTKKSLFESFKVSLGGDLERLTYTRYRNCPACGTLTSHSSAQS